MSTKKGKITDLQFDDKNMNKGSQFGNSLLEKSFQKFGAGRSVLIDKNNRLIGGNKSAAKFGELGGENILIVEADKNTLVAVRRNDIDLNTAEGREFALAENATAKANIVWDAEVMEVMAETVDVQVWGVHDSAPAISGTNDEGEEYETPIDQTRGDDSAKDYQASLFPLGIVLTKAMKTRWEAYKKRIGKIKDADAFTELFKKAEDDHSV